jgi:hypothetical protein
VTDDSNCGPRIFGTITCSGGTQVNRVTLYQIQVADGVWEVETRYQAVGASLRRLGMTTRSTEKANPLDLLKNGDKVLFRVEKHREIGGTETNIYVPYADNPDKGVLFVTTFTPSAVEVIKPVSDNVRAMCDTHKMPPELEKRLCAVPEAK